MLTSVRLFSLTMVTLLVLILIPGTFPVITASPSTDLVNPQTSITYAENVELVGQIGGSISAIAVQGHYAYVGLGPRLVIFDVSNPASPAIVGKTPPLPIVVADLTVRDNYVYVVGTTDFILVDGGLYAISISDPTNPTVVGFCEMDKMAYGVAVDGDFAYVSGYYGLWVIDISTPENPVEVGFCQMDGHFTDLVAAGDFIYTVGWGFVKGLSVVSVSTPSNPREISFFETPAAPHHIAIAGNHVYITDENLRVLDVSNPSEPMEVSVYHTGGDALELALAGDYVYVIEQNVWYDGQLITSALGVIDFSILSSPVRIGLYDVPGVADMALAGDHLYITDSGLRTLDVSAPANPTELAFYDTSDFSANGVTVAEGYAHITSGHSLSLVDISTPINPVMTATYDTFGSAEDVAVVGDYAYVAQGCVGVGDQKVCRLQVIDVSTPADPVEAGSCDIPDDAYGVSVIGSRAYVAADEAGLRVVDVSDPVNPAEVGFCDTPGGAHNVTVSGNYAYIADGWDGGLQVVDISNPAYPRRVGSYDTPGYAESVEVVGNYAYVADGSIGGLQILDISTPTSPRWAGSYVTPGHPYDVAVNGSHAYIADGNSGLRVVDISDPANPAEVGSFDTPRYAYEVTMAGDYIYVADGSGGLFILRYMKTESSYSVFGRVTDEDDNSIPGVTVSAGFPHAATTDANGNYTITDLVSGTYTLRPDMQGYTFVPPTCTVSVPPDATGQDFVAVLAPKLTYVGPRYLPDNLFLPSCSVITDEVDHRITMGDHIHLRLPFENIGGQSISNATIEVIGAPELGDRAEVRIYKDFSWPDYPLSIPLTPSTIDPGEAGIADFWIYVSNPDYEVRSSEIANTWLRVRTEDGGWTIRINLRPPKFTISGNEFLKAGSCLHNPDNSEIQMYAQYATGATISTPPTNDGDPDTPEQALRNLASKVNEEFRYASEGESPRHDDPRLEDKELLGRRHDFIGVCRHYADLTAGLLRALGFPSRITDAMLLKPPPHQDELTGHLWVEAYLGSGGWRQVDSTAGVALLESFYEEKGYEVEDVWADRYPLSSASRWVDQQYQCIAPCYMSPENCTLCRQQSNTGRDPAAPFELSCVESVTPTYTQQSLHRTVSVDSAQLEVRILTSASATRTVPFTFTSTTVNRTTARLSAITTTVATSEYMHSVKPLLKVAPSYRTITDVDPGQVVTVTWVVTPLITGRGMPLRVAAISGELFEVAEQPLVVNEPGTLPDLFLVDGCGTDTVNPGQPLTLTASVLNHYLQPIADIVTMITATLYSTPTVSYSSTVNLTYCAECGYYRHVTVLPSYAPTGRYEVDYVATRRGYDPAQTGSAVFVVPTITMTLEVTPTLVLQHEPMTITTSVFERGTTVSGAGIYAELTTSSGVVTVPLVHSGDTYSMTLRPTDIEPSLGEAIQEGPWLIEVTADYYGSKVTASAMVTISAPLETVMLTKTVTPEGQVNYGDRLTYTLVLSASPGTLLGLYDPLTETSFLQFVERPPGVTHVDTTNGTRYLGGVVTGTMTVTPTNQITVSFVAQVGVPGTLGWTADVANKACVYPFGGTLGGCIWSNEVMNPASRPYEIYLPLVMRNP